MSDRGRGRGRGQQRPSSAPAARERSSSAGRRPKSKAALKKPTEEQHPTEGPGADIIVECSGSWTASDGAYYEVTEDWKCIRTDQKGNERTYDLSFDHVNGIILWGNTFFFDKHSSRKEDVMEWFRQTDPDMTSPAFTWNRCEEGEKPPKKQKEAAEPKEKAKSKAKAKAKAKETSRSKSPKQAGSEEFHVQKLDGSLKIKAGDKLRVVRIEGSQIVCVVVGSEEMEGKQPQPQSKAKAKARSRARGASSRQLSSRGRAKAKGTKPEKGAGSDAFSQILGTWVGSKSETYLVEEDWSCTRKDKRGTVTYDLAWDEENEIVLWGSTYMFDPQDVEEDPDEISWYRQSDLDKTTPIFSWMRQIE